MARNGLTYKITATAAVLDNGRPKRDITAKLIPLGCKCSWAWSHIHNAMQLKYHHAACPVRHNR